MKIGVLTKQAKISTVPIQAEPQTRISPRTNAKSLENGSDLAADFLVGALLYSLFASGNVSELLPDGDDD